MHKQELARQKPREDRPRGPMPMVQPPAAVPVAAVDAVRTDIAPPARMAPEPAVQDRDQARKKQEDAERRRREDTGRRPEQDSRPVRVPVPLPQRPAAPPPAAKAPRVPVRARLAAAGRLVGRKFAAVPWQVWRTLFGIVVMAVLWIWIARACEQSRIRAAAAPPAQVPLIDPCHPPPEPYLD